MVTLKKNVDLVKMPPLVQDASLIKVQTMKRKYVDQVRKFSLKEFRELLETDHDFETNTRISDPWSTIRIIGKVGYIILFTYVRGYNAVRQFGACGGLDFTEIFRKRRYEAEGIEWPLDDESKAKVEKIDREVWEEMERLPQIFED